MKHLIALAVAGIAYWMIGMGVAAAILSKEPNLKPYTQSMIWGWPTYVVAQSYGRFIYGPAGGCGG